MGLNGVMGDWLRDLYPEEGLECCSREEAIEICSPYAEAFGYGNADISVYAMTLECLEAAWRDRRGHAPDPDFQIVSMEEIGTAREEGDDEKADQLYRQRLSAAGQGIAWTKEDEALMLIYRPLINGKAVNSSVQYLKLLYVPGYDGIVYASGYPCLSERESAGIQDVISQEKAVSEAILAMGVRSQESFRLRDISLEYYAPLELWRGTDEDKVATPCWKIDFERTEGMKEEKLLLSVNGSILVNALDGQWIEY